MFFENPKNAEEEAHNFMQMLVVEEFRREERERVARNKEYAKRYYAEKNQEVRLRLLEAKKEEFAEEDYAIAVAEILLNENTGRRGRKLFDSSGLILLHCESCGTTVKKINSLKRTHCDNCKAELKFQCIKCEKLYGTHTACCTHIKHKHPDAKPEF